MIGVHEIVEYASYKNYLGKKCPYEGSPFQVYKQMSSKVKGDVILRRFLKST